MAKLQKMVGDSVTAEQIVGFDIYKILTEWRQVSQNHRRDLPIKKLLVDRRFRANPINRRDEQTVHPPRHQATDGNLLPFDVV